MCVAHWVWTNTMTWFLLAILFSWTLASLGLRYSYILNPKELTAHTDTPHGLECTLDSRNSCEQSLLFILF